MFNKFIKTIVFIWLVILIVGCQKTSDYILINGFTMGTSYQVTLDDPQKKAVDIHQQIESELRLINQQMSTYIDDSNLSLFNQINSTECQTLPPAVIEVIANAREVSIQTKGKFDVTLSPLIEEWGFDKRQTNNQVPTEQRISELLAKTGYDKLTIQSDCVQKSIAALSVNLSAIAKGYGVDRVAQIVEQNGIENYLVEIGGETASKGINPSSKPWRLAVEAPVQQRQIQQVFSPLNKGVATSGDYRNYFEKDGIRYSHTIDPTTGKPITHNLASITVLHQQTMLADAYATAFMVMGEVDSLEFANQRNIPVYLIVKTDTGFETIANDAFKIHISAAEK